MSSKSTTTPEFISLRDAATRTGFSVFTIRDKIDLGELPAYRISDKPNSALRVRVRDVDALMKHVEAAPPDPYGMSHDGTGGGDQVSEPGPGDDQHQRGEPDGGRGSQGAGELGDPRGAELERRRGRASRRDAQASEAELVPPLDQPVLPWVRVPLAAELAEYDRFMPGLAREIVNEAHANMASDRRINELQVQIASKLDIRGQAIAAALSGTSIGSALLCLFLLHPPWLAVFGAGIFGLGAIAPVINAFLQRRGSKDDGGGKPAPPPASPDGD